MLKTWFLGLVAGASMLAPGLLAAQDVDFDQGVRVDGVVATMPQVKLEQAPADVPAAAWTFKEAEQSVKHAMGLVKKELPSTAWKPYESSIQGGAIQNTFDLRTKLSQIEDQGNCGSCWAFSLTATHRDGFAVFSKDPGRLSQEWLVDNSPEAQGCNGGYFDSANDFIKPKGQPLWSACPYKTGSGKCAKDLPFAAHITGWHMLGAQDTGPSVRDIETYMTSSGRPLSIAVAAGVGRWMYYGTGVYNACKTGELDHMINIVGWDNEGAQFDGKGNLPPGKGIWILRNSWGSGWGENGYMRTKMTDASGQRCNAVAQEAAYFDFE